MLIFKVLGNYMTGNANNLVWLDMEMTGLDPDGDRIIADKKDPGRARASPTGRMPHHDPGAARGTC